MADPITEGIDPISLRDTSDTQINPATEEGQEAIAGLVTEPFDYVGAAYPDTTTEVYTFKEGGLGGATVATVTVVYTDTTKEFITSVTSA